MPISERTAETGTREAAVAVRWRAWFVPVAVLLAVAEVALIVLGFRAGMPHLAVRVPALIGPALAAAAFLATATGTDGVLRTFWRRVAAAMAGVEVAASARRSTS